MSRIRVLDLAKELNIDTKTALAKLGDLGIQVKNHFNAVGDSEADKLRVYIRSGRNPDKEAAKSANKVIIRRRADAPRTEEGSDAEGGMAASPAPSVVAVETPPPAARPLSAPAAFETAPASAPPVKAAPSPAEFASRSALSPDTAAVRPSVSAPSASSAPSVASASVPTGSAPQATRSQEQANFGGVNATSIQEPSVKPFGSPSASTPSGATILRAGATPSPAAPDAGSAGATVLSRPSAEPGSSATVVRQAPPAGGATVIRRADVNPAGGVSTYRPEGRNQAGFRSDSMRPAEGGTYRTEGGYQRPAYRPGEGQPGGPGYVRPVYRPGEGQPGGPGYVRPAAPGEAQMRGGYGAPRPAGAPGGYGPRPAGSTGGYGPRPAGAPGGYGPRPAGAPGGFGPRPGGFGSPAAGGASTDQPAGKEGPSRPREKEKELELRKRKLAEEENRKKGLPAKGGRHGGQTGEFDPDLELVAVDESGEAIPQVRTMIPNRRKPGGARRKDHRHKVESTPMKAAKRIVRVNESISVNDLAGEMAVKSSAVVKALMGLGMMASVNQVLDMETATLVAQEFGYEVQNTTVTIGDILNTKKTSITDTAQTESLTRPPVITIMGHVDHGKTSLLDAIRKADVAGGEAGGITQHIGAYQVERDGRKITFLDTPGHEAFTQMRARGAQVTDVVILVVAADDGVMPQTLEAIAHAKAAKVPVIVAMNKVDKAGANTERIMRELSGHGITPEEWGGESMFIPVSAKTQQGIPELLEGILLQADVLDLRAAPEGLASGFVIEAKLDKARGPVATVLVTQGTLKQQDWFVAGRTYGRVRAMFDDKGNRLKEALPAMPVEILGLSEVPAAGDTFNCVVNDAIAKEAVAFRIEKQRQKDLAANQKSSLEDIMAKLAAGDGNKAKELPIILKADTHGSVEAIRGALAKLDTEKVKNRIILSAVGGITETDITLAEASEAIILGFNVRPDRAASQVAEARSVNVKVFNIIYELIDTVQSAMVGKLAPIKSEKVQGHAEVRNLFSVPKIGVISGSAVTDGKMTRNSHARVIRDNIVIYTGRIGSLKRFKDDAKEVVQGFECGIGIEGYNDLKVGDVIESFIIEETPDTL
ncbi:MAG: translation initiation factor IF-2 [Silvanigrellales bacterium]|nr:translation initiation factor IF-2 [Silvanigrellales bacterium]